MATNKPTPKKYKLKLNSMSHLEVLLQELYDETSKNIVEIQNEINKLSSSTQLNNEIMDAKAKYAKAMNDFSSNKNKALATKMDIAKLMTEVIKFNGNVKKMNEESEAIPDWGAFVSNINERAENNNMLENTVEVYTTK